MEDLLFLCHRIPFPPDKGDKIRSWQMLRYLAGSHRIFLGCFVDDAADRHAIGTLRQVCHDVACFDISPRLRKLRALARWRRNVPLTLDYFRDRRLDQWIRSTVERRRIRRTLVFSSSMAPYAIGLSGSRVLDLVDVDSAKWRAYASRRPWPVSAVYAREARTLLNFERQMAAIFDQTLFVSEAEAAEFLAVAPECAGSVTALRNGVDFGHFAPCTTAPSPFPGGIRPLVFTGAMDYWPNIDAVTWFAQQVLPRLGAAGVPFRFYIVGSNPTAEVRRLGRLPDVEVTGRVPDTRPYIAHAHAAVAPLRVARGIQNKVLEAMAMATPVIATPDAHRGIGAQAGREVLVARTPDEWARLLLATSTDELARIGAAGRAMVVRHHAWESSLRALDRWFPSCTATTPREPASVSRQPAVVHWG
jgi:sugar transferase (PEP-CTERM/EpsH1 system associated)